MSICDLNVLSGLTQTSSLTQTSDNYTFARKGYNYTFYVIICEDVSKTPSVKILVVGLTDFKLTNFSYENSNDTQSKALPKVLSDSLPETFKLLLYHNYELRNKLYQEDALTYLSVIGNICRFFGLVLYSTLDENFIHYKLTEKVFTVDVDNGNEKVNVDSPLMSTLYILLMYCMHKDSNVVHNTIIYYNSIISNFTLKSTGLCLFYSNIERKIKYSVNLKKMIKLIQFIN